ncbi:efflux RND transporter periplasmic adaptor subunit [Cognatilysobacter terrigena]|uniref:efflux RND transporter periplasmic adaptor subunit n=1 Tax=Cognatilysobacter terrigena TaxID=2488749 RepID=UPI0010607CE2|nr:efflux RND transporter periplasmic adaptor subunit [Lysobacter terrigena]
MSRMNLFSRGAALALAIPTLLVAAGCSSQAEPSAAMPPPPEVSVAQVLSKPVGQWDDFTGRVSAVDTVELRPRVSGYIDRVAFAEGQEVRKGDLLFVIDPRRFKANLDRAVAELERAKSEARLAQAQDRRAATLVEAQAISREEFESRRAANAQGSAAVRAAEAAVEAARLELQYTQVRAPVSGRVGRALVTRGNLAQADSTLLTTVVSVDPMYVYFDADEQAFLRYKRLEREGQGGAQNTVRVALADETGYPHEAKLDFVDNQVDPQTGSIRARAVVENPDRRFTPGMFARVQLQGGATQNAMLVDDKAVLTDQDRKYVYVLGPHNAATRKDITVGRVVDGLRVVTSGLKPDDRVIVHGVQKVFFPGMPVVPKPIAMGAPPPSPALAAR